MSLWCDDFYVTPQGYYVIKVITNQDYFTIKVCSVGKSDRRRDRGVIF